MSVTIPLLDSIDATAQEKGRSLQITNALDRVVFLTLPVAFEVHSSLQANEQPIVVLNSEKLAIHPQETVLLERIQSTADKILCGIKVDGGGCTGYHPDFTNTDKIEVTFYPLWIQPRWGNPWLSVSTTYDRWAAMQPYGI